MYHKEWKAFNLKMLETSRKVRRYVKPACGLVSLI